jgi:O-antigen ligase
MYNVFPVLGFATYFSLTIVLLSVVAYSKLIHFQAINIGIVVACLITSCYSIIQRFGYDIFDWVSLTNGIIGTLGNPNFQSSFAALGLVPTAVFFWNLKYKYKWLSSAFFALLIVIVIIKTQSTQGYITALLSVYIFIIIYYWYKNKLIFFSLSVFLLLSGFVSILGMLNKGPLNYYLYKVSVQSRGDFWRSAINAANDHPFFGVGIDSFGDSYLKYRDSIAVSHPWAEYTDNAHNYFLDYAVSAGYPMAILQLSLIVFTLICFLQILRKQIRFDQTLTAIFVAWSVFQAQSFISPGNLSLMIWNAVFSGTLIGYSILTQSSTQDIVLSDKKLIPKTKVQSYTFVFAGLLIIYPLFNADRLQLKAMSTGNGDLAISSAKQYPESVLRYQVITRELLNSNLFPQALDVARSAVRFNPNSANLWALIVINPAAPKDERIAAKSEILKLDPLNKEVINYEIK